MIPELAHTRPARLSSDEELDDVARRLRAVTATVGAHGLRRRREELSMIEARQRLRALAAEVDVHAIALLDDGDG